ncbi:hypothetical protein B296_00028420, partial [Ensete ventricosum]
CKRFTYCNGTQSSAFTFSLCFFCFSDKLYKEIRDMNYEVVVQVAQFRSAPKGNFNPTRLCRSKIYSEIFLQRHVNLAHHLQSFTCKPSFHARLDIEQTILELQNFEA